MADSWVRVVHGPRRAAAVIVTVAAAAGLILAGALAYALAYSDLHPHARTLLPAIRLLRAPAGDPASLVLGAAAGLMAVAFIVLLVRDAHGAIRPDRPSEPADRP